jgi:hypothetical protein
MLYAARRQEPIAPRTVDTIHRSTTKLTWLIGQVNFYLACKFFLYVISYKRKRSAGVLG